MELKFILESLLIASPKPLSVAELRDTLTKAASAGLEAKNATAFKVLENLQLTTDQQNEIAAMIDSDGQTPDAAAKAWVEANAAVVDAWLA